MFLDDYLPPLETKTKGTVSGNEEAEKVNYALVVIKAKLGVEAMDGKEE